MNNENEINIEELMNYTNNPDLDPTIQSFFQRIKSQKPTAILYKAFQRIIEAIKTISEIDKDQIPGINLRALAPSFSRPTSVSNDKYTAPKGTRDKMGKQELALKTLLIALGSISALSTPVYANQSPDTPQPSMFVAESNKNLTSYGSNQVPNYLIDVDDPYLYMNYLQNPSSWFLSPLKEGIKNRFRYLSCGEELGDGFSFYYDTVSVATDITTGKSYHAERNFNGYSDDPNMSISPCIRIVTSNQPDPFIAGTNKYDCTLLTAELYISGDHFICFSDSNVNTDPRITQSLQPFLQSGAFRQAINYATGYNREKTPEEVKGDSETFNNSMNAAFDLNRGNYGRCY